MLGNRFTLKTAQLNQAAQYALSPTASAAAPSEIDFLKNFQLNRSLSTEA